MPAVSGYLDPDRVSRDLAMHEEEEGFSFDRLDSWQRELEDHPDNRGRVHETLDRLFWGLRAKKLVLSEPLWREWVDRCRRHPIRSVLHQDPFTCRAFSKPRGYAGDAKLLDYIYGREERWPPPEATPLGLHIFHYTTQAPASRGVRARRAFVATLIDRLAEEVSQPRILSIAAGHLREAGMCVAVKRRKLGRFVALDSDAWSLREVERCYGWTGVETVAASVRKLITGRLSLGEFDLIYSTGLFDYMGAAAGQRLVATLFRMLRPRGRLLVANFLPGVRDVGYMETFMDWKLVYRTRHEMMGLTREIAQEEIRDIQLAAEENRNILFLQVRRSE